MFRCFDCCLKTKLIVCCVIWGFEGGLPGRKKSQNLAVAARPDAGGALPNWDNRRRAHKMRGVMLFGCCFCIGGGGGGGGYFFWNWHLVPLLAVIGGLA